MLTEPAAASACMFTRGKDLMVGAWVMKKRLPGAACEAAPGSPVSVGSPRREVSGSVEDHSGVVSGVLSECAGICVDRILGDVVDYAVLSGRYLLRLCVRAGIMAGECASVAEHVVAPLGLICKLECALLVDEFGSVGGVKRRILAADDGAAADEIEVLESLAVLSEFGIGFSAVEVDFAQTADDGRMEV